MANKTTNYGLTKPLPEEFYDIGVHNANMDIIDAELKKKYGSDNKLTAVDVGAADRNSTLLSEKADLNDVKEEGEYCYPWYNETIANTPVHSAFHLSVKKLVEGGVVQEYYQYSGGKTSVWHRQSSSNAWYAWTKVATTDDAVKKSGDTVTGKIYSSAANGAFGSSSDNSAVRIDGGTSYDKGAFLTLNGKDSNESGVFQLVASNNDSTRKELKGFPDGTLTWNGKSIYHTGNKPTATDVGAFGQIGKWEGTDLNNFKTLGAVYTTSEQSNRPSNTSPYGTVWNISGNGSTYLIQHYFDAVNRVIYYRGYVDGVWTDWKTFSTSDHTHTPASIGAAPSSHTHAASDIKAGTFADTGVIAKTGTDYTTYRVRNVGANTTDMTAKSTSLTNGNIYLQYE